MLRGHRAGAAAPDCPRRLRVWKCFGKVIPDLHLEGGATVLSSLLHTPRCRHMAFGRGEVPSVDSRVGGSQGGWCVQGDCSRKEEDTCKGMRSQCIPEWPEPRETEEGRPGPGYILPVCHEKSRGSPHRIPLSQRSIYNSQFVTSPISKSEAILKPSNPALYQEKGPEW